MPTHRRALPVGRFDPEPMQFCDLKAQYAALSLVQGGSIALARRAKGDVELHPMEIASFKRLLK